MIIEDDELRGLFQAETDEHLQVLEQGLLRLEVAPADEAALDETFRAAHSLKGAARMLQVDKVEAIAHRFEDVLGKAKNGKIVLLPETADRLYQALDAIREFCQEAITGERSTTVLEGVIKQLDAQGPFIQVAESDEVDAEFADDKDMQPAGNYPRTKLDIQTARLAQRNLNEDESNVPPGEQPDNLLNEEDEFHSVFEAETDDPSGVVDPQTGATMNETKAASKTNAGTPPSYSIETIRVQAQKLDALMSYAGELMVARGRIAGRVGQIEKLTELWEKWNRASYAVRSFANGEMQSLERDLKEVIDYLSQDRERLDRMGQLIRELENSAKGDQARIDLVATNLDEGIRTIRLLPMSTLFNLFPRMVRDMAREQAKEVAFAMQGAETAADKRILEEMKDPLMHMLRNAIDHGIELPEAREKLGKPRSARLWLRAFQTGANVFIEIEDDGGGIDLEAVKRVALKRRVCNELELAEMSDYQVRQLIFSPGFSTKAIVTDVSGRGIGLDVVRENVDRLRGKIEVESARGKGTRFRLVFPLTLATRRVLIAGVAGYKYAIPVESVVTTRLVRPDEIFTLQGQETIVVGDVPISVGRLADLLEFKMKPRKESNRGKEVSPAEKELACIVLRVDGDSFGFMVDELVDEQEVVLKSHGAILRRVRNVSGSTILQSGEVCIALNPQDLIKSARIHGSPGAAVDEVEFQSDEPRLILLVEDSIVTRTQEKRILEAAGYEVITAVDGLDALNKLNSRAFDAVISDVEMPNLSGLDFTEKVRRIEQHKNLPIILVTSLASDDDRKRGMDVGADAYLTKPGFDQTVFLQTLKRFI